MNFSEKRCQVFAVFCRFSAFFFTDFLQIFKFSTFSDSIAPIVYRELFGCPGIDSHHKIREVRSLVLTGHWLRYAFKPHKNTSNWSD